MTQPNLVQLAQAGDASAIAILMNSTLQAIGVTARVVLKEDDLYVLLESEHVLAENSCIEFIRKGIARLGMVWLSSAIIYSRIVGQPSPMWVQKIELRDAAEFTNPFVLAPGSVLDTDGGILRRLPTPIPRRVRLFDLLMLGFPLLLVLGSIQIWSRYVASSFHVTPFPGISSQSNNRPSISPSSGSPSSRAASNSSDALDAAIQQANVAVKHQKTAKTREEWRTIADDWWKAIALLEGIPASHPKHAVVQQKLALYRRNLAFVAKDRLSLTGMDLKKVISGESRPNQSCTPVKTCSLPRT